MSLSLRRALITLAVLLPSVAHAGGYDTPMLYSARHMGMGGTAIGYVSDPSALFHNPAGLGQIRRFGALLDISLLMAHVQASPQAGALDVESELTLAPVFLVGAGYRLNRWLTAGAAIYPVASAGATYSYPFGGNDVQNRTRLVFIEGSVALAANLPGNVRLGAGYRATYVNLERFQGAAGAPVPGLDFTMTGFNWAGFRLGAQWSPLPWLQVGGAYRHQTRTRVSNDSGIALGDQYTDIETTFVLPTKMGAGARADWRAFSLALDTEYLFNSQNTAYPLIGTPPGAAMPSRIPNVFNWSNEFTLRTGVEYRLLPSKVGAGAGNRLALRAGYIYDGKTTNERFPSAFGTPPGPTQILTAGAGWNAGAVQFNVAYGYRFGSGNVRSEDLNNPGMPCAFCGIAGNEPYRIWIHALYADVSVNID